MPTQQTKVCQEFGEGYTLIADPYEIEHIMESSVCPDYRDDFGSLFVKVGDGDYDEIWGSGYSVAWLHIVYYRVPIADGRCNEQ